MTTHATPPASDRRDRSHRATAPAHRDATGAPSCNLVVLRGRLSSAPRVRELPSGCRLTNLEVTTRIDGVASSVPVAVLDGTVPFEVGSEVVVVGTARRRFFRAGGATASRTEVVADHVVAASQRRRVRRLVSAAIAAVEAAALA